LINDGKGGAVTNLVSKFDPSVNQYQITTFTAADTSLEYQLRIQAVTAGGSVTSGVSSFILASVPQKPLPTQNDATVTNDSTIKVLFGTVLPDNGGSPIISIQLYSDDGQGG
jgi:hypothetical protein